jgi:hypothetical protein
MIGFRYNLPELRPRLSATMSVIILLILLLHRVRKGQILY